MNLSELMQQYGDYEVKEGFMDLLEKPKPKTVYDLKYGDRYCYITADGELRFVSWQNDESDKNKLAIGNIFLTEEDAEFARERLMVITELKKYAKEFSDEERSNTTISKYVIYLSSQDYVMYIASTYSVRYPFLYFQSEEKAKEAINAVGEERIKKYYFGVRE